MEDDAKPPPPDLGEGTKSFGVPADATCWVCLDGGDLQRSCACRGPSAGYAHIECILSYARAKLDDSLFGGSRTKNRVAYLGAYLSCPLCSKVYTGQMQQTLSTELTAALEHLPISDCRRATAIYLKADAYLKNEPKKAAGEFRSLLVKENPFRDLKMKALVFLVQIEHEEGNADNVIMYLSIADDFYGAHLRYFQKIGLDPDMLGLRAIKEHIFTATLGNLPPSYYATTARDLETALETRDLSPKDRDRIQERLIIVFERSKQYVKALKLSKRILDDQVREFGPTHIRTLQVIGIVDRLKEKYRAYLERHR